MASMIKKIVGLEGVANCGKTHVLRAMVNKLVSTGAKIVEIFCYDGMKLTDMGMPTEGEFVKFLRVNNKIVVVSTGGDYLNVPIVVGNIINAVTLTWILFFAAMRMGCPNVSGAYANFAEKEGVVHFDTIYLPRFRPNIDSVEKQYSGQALWVDRLISLI